MNTLHQVAARDAAVDEHVWRKCSRRILPLLFGIFFFSHLNRVNLSYAADALTRDLSFSPVVYGLGAGLFFAGYSMLQVPANLIAARLGVVRVMVLLMICWGLSSLLNGAIQNAHQFYALRFLLGVFEAGITPVTLLFITLWFSANRRGTAFGLFAVAMPVAGAIGGPLSATILESMSGVGNLAGWRWLFLLEALPTIVLAFITLRHLPASPAEARWLSSEERAYLLRSQRVEEAAKLDASPRGAGAQRRIYRAGFALRVVLLSGTWACFTGAYVGLFYWMPILLSSVFGLANERVGWFVGAAYGALAITLVLSGPVADRIRWVRGMLLAALAAFSLALYGAASATAIGIAGPLFFVAMSAIGVGMGAFWSVALSEFSADEAPLGIGIVNCLASVGAFGILYVYGFVAESMGSIQAGLVSLAISGGAAAVFTVYWYRQKLGANRVRPALA